MTLQYEDLDSDGQLSVLVDIQLPENGTWKVMRPESEATSTTSNDTDTHETGETLKSTRKTWPSQSAASSHTQTTGKRVRQLKLTAHPRLREHGSENMIRMDRTKLARSGCTVVSINTGGRSRNDPERAGQAEVNYLPEFPRGEDQATLERTRLQIIQEVDETERNQTEYR